MRRLSSLTHKPRFQSRGLCVRIFHGLDDPNGPRDGKLRSCGVSFAGRTLSDLCDQVVVFSSAGRTLSDPHMIACNVPSNRYVTGDHVGPVVINILIDSCQEF